VSGDATPSELAAELRRIDLFDDLDDDELGRWASVAQVREVPAGEVIAEPAQPVPGLILLLEGTVQTMLIEDGRSEPAGQHFAPTWLGAIAVLTDGPMGVTVQAETPLRVALIPPDDFFDLALSQRSVHARMMSTIRPTIRRITAMEQNRERLASLGTMAAGLAHELNNPAAAAKRAASEMCDAVEVLSSTIGHFVDSGVERVEAQKLVEMQREALAQAASREPLDTLDASDAEDELLEALEEMDDVAEPWRLAEPLSAAGLDAAWVARVRELAGPATGAALSWVAASLTARGLAGELSDSAARMSNLVKAVKTYAYMDRGEVVRADIHEGIDTTLVVLGHKMKHTQIAVERDYDRSLPKLSLRGSELNQVWTNLLDNAIDTLCENGGSGTITVRTRREGDQVLVEVADDGPGIPDDVRERIFDPFFTTKPAGSGTGLGLDTARRIVEERHRGTLAVESEPGRGTTFRVWLPVENAAR
jgi:signal transduction histidine kinase